MAFKELTKEEIENLTERQKKLYFDELNLYKERCAFIDKIEQLENVKLPKIKPDYIRLKKIQLKVLDKIEIKNSKVKLVDVSSIFKMDRKKSVRRIENINNSLKDGFKIEKNENIIINKPDNKKFVIPKLEGVILPEINIEKFDNIKNFNFEKVELTDIPNVVIDVNLQTKEFEFDKFEIEQNDNIVIANPVVDINLEGIGNVDINLDINTDFVEPEVFEFENVSVELEESKVDIPESQLIEFELPDGFTVDNPEIEIAKLDEIEVAQIEDFKIDEIETAEINMPNIKLGVLDEEKLKISKIDAAIIDAPKIKVGGIKKNKVNLVDIKLPDIPEIRDVKIDDIEVAVDKVEIVMPKIATEFNFNFDIKKNMAAENVVKKFNDLYAKPKEIKIDNPEIVVNNCEVNIAEPSIDEGACEKLMQIINGMGASHEK